MKYIVKNFPSKKIYSSFNDAVNDAKEQILNYIYTEKDAFCNMLPFSVGAHIGGLYDDLILTDEEVIVIDKIQLLLDRLFDDKIFDYIKKDYEYTSADKEYDKDCIFKIIKKDDDLELSLRTPDCLLKTNMFNLRENHNYYFSSHQRIIMTENKDKAKLGKVVSLCIRLECKE